jgi:hypothetical protein
MTIATANRTLPLLPVHLALTIRQVLAAVVVGMCTALTVAVGRAALSSDRDRRARCTGSRGQATTEYALVLLAAALVALLVVAWATAGGGAAKIGRLFNAVIDSVIDKV